jgi:hypothetical protein
MNMDGITELFLKHATEDGDPDHIVAMVEKLQGLIVPMFALYILIEAKNHEDHDSDCEVVKKLPEAVEGFIKQFSDDIRLHVEINLVANGMALTKTHNQKTYDEIMATLNQAE